jgi:PAS domain S-box-containing protein
MERLHAWIRDQLFEQVPCNIAIIDPNYNIVDHNRNFQELFGDGRGRLCYSVYKKEKSRCPQCLAVDCFADGKVRINDEEGLDKNGRRAFYLVHMVPLVTENGEIPYIIEMSTDITETKRLQREYQILFEKVPCYVTVLNRDHRIVRANEAMEKTFGPATGEQCWQVFKKSGLMCEACPAAMAYTDGQTHSSEQVGIDRNGEPTHYIVTASPLSPAPPFNHVIEIAVDITRLKRLEEEKLEAERLAAVGQTVAGLAHGIKNILVGLEGGVYVFKSGLDRDDRKRLHQGWEMLDHNIGRISALSKNLLLFSKGTIPRAQMVRPADIVREVVELYKDKAERIGVILRAEIDDDVAPAAMNPEGIHACLTNLVANAIDACEISDKPECLVVIRCREESSGILFEVEDSGCGVESEVRHKVFTNFFTTKNESGTGLGLLMTRKIVQEHGGKISFESVPGEGSTFKLLFPRDRLPSAESPAAATDPHPTSEEAIHG